ncbi:MAG: hypothetical protein ACFBWO_15275 [Paracoccaceae bacterium]
MIHVDLETFHSRRELRDRVVISVDDRDHDALLFTAESIAPDRWRLVSKSREVTLAAYDILFPEPAHDEAWRCSIGRDGVGRLIAEGRDALHLELRRERDGVTLRGIDLAIEIAPRADPARQRLALDLTEVAPAIRLSERATGRPAPRVAGVVCDWRFPEPAGRAIGDVALRVEAWLAAEGTERPPLPLRVVEEDGAAARPADDGVAAGRGDDALATTLMTLRGRDARLGLVFAPGTERALLDGAMRGRRSLDASVRLGARLPHHGDALVGEASAPVRLVLDDRPGRLFLRLLPRHAADGEARPAPAGAREALEIDLLADDEARHARPLAFAVLGTGAAAQSALDLRWHLTVAPAERAMGAVALDLLSDHPDDVLESGVHGAGRRIELRGAEDSEARCGEATLVLVPRDGEARLRVLVSTRDDPVATLRIAIRNRAPRRFERYLAIDFGTSSVCAMRYAPDRPDGPRPVPLGAAVPGRASTGGAGEAPDHLIPSGVRVVFEREPGEAPAATWRDEHAPHALWHAPEGLGAARAAAAGGRGFRVALPCLDDPDSPAAEKAFVVDALKRQFLHPGEAVRWTRAVPAPHLAVPGVEDLAEAVFDELAAFHLTWCGAEDGAGRSAMHEVWGGGLVLTHPNQFAEADRERLRRAAAPLARRLGHAPAETVLVSEGRAALNAQIRRHRDALEAMARERADDGALRLMAFDMGAGTLDLSVVDAHAGPDGAFRRLEPVDAVGAAVGGDTIDLVLHAIAAERLDALAREGAFEGEPPSARAALEAGALGGAEGLRARLLTARLARAIERAKIALHAAMAARPGEAPVLDIVVGEQDASSLAGFRLREGGRGDGLRVDGAGGRSCTILSLPLEAIEADARMAALMDFVCREATRAVAGGRAIDALLVSGRASLWPLVRRGLDALCRPDPPGGHPLAGAALLADRYDPKTVVARGALMAVLDDHWADGTGHDPRFGILETDAETGRVALHGEARACAGIHPFGETRVVGYPAGLLGEDEPVRVATAPAWWLALLSDCDAEPAWFGNRRAIGVGRDPASGRRRLETERLRATPGHRLPSVVPMLSLHAPARPPFWSALPTRPCPVPEAEGRACR